MDGMIDLDDIHLEMDDIHISSESAHNLGYTAQLETQVIEVTGERILYMKLTNLDRDSINVYMALDVEMVEKLYAHLNVFLLAEMMR